MAKKHPTKISEKLRKKIIADYVECQNYSETARKNGVSPNTVKNYVQRDSTFAETCEQKKEEVEQDILGFLESKGKNLKALYTMTEKRIVELIPSTNDIQRLATAWSILFDKHMKRIEVMQRDREIAVKEREVAVKEYENRDIGQSVVQIILERKKPQGDANDYKDNT